MTPKRVALDDAPAVVAWLKRNATTATRDGMARFALPSDHALGVTMAQLRTLAKLTGRNHALAADLWATGIYEARMLAALIDDPDAVTSAPMDRWCKDFDNWGIADTVCFALFDRTEHRWAKVTKWATRKPEFEKRAAFALLWSLTVHDKAAPDSNSIAGLALIEREATDERHFVKNGINMALRAVGKRNRTLNTAAVATAEQLAASDNEHARWIGKDALRELQGPVVARRISK